MSTDIPASPAASRTAVTFENRHDHRLFGVLHRPAIQAPGALAVVLLSPGVKMRVGPQRLYLKLTDLFVGMGLPVLRFDFHGLGDSEGRLSEELLRDVYNHIEVGRFVDDTLDAMDWMTATCGSRAFILSGLCGGAITGLLAGARDERVAGLLGLGITPVLASRSADPSRYMTSGQLDQIGQSYLRKLTDPRSWLRLLTLQSDYRLLWRSLSRRFAPPVHARPVSSETPAAADSPDDNANPLFPPAFFRFTDTDRPMLLVFGGADRLHFEFEEKFVHRHQERLASLAARYTVHVIPKANHVLSFAEWQRDLLDVSHTWLLRRFGASVLPAFAPSLPTVQR